LEVVEVDGYWRNSADSGKAALEKASAGKCPGSAALAKATIFHKVMGQIAGGGRQLVGTAAAALHAPRLLVISTLVWSGPNR
jgi:hypothetical protein